MDSKSLSHTKWKCQYLLCLYQNTVKKKLFGELKHDVREILSTLCKYKGVEIIEGAVCITHVHMCMSIPPKLSIITISMCSSISHFSVLFRWN